MHVGCQPSSTRELQHNQLIFFVIHPLRYVLCKRFICVNEAQQVAGLANQNFAQAAQNFHRRLNFAFRNFV